jgi:ABC-type thiamine transport system substrate-binding protein
MATKTQAALPTGMWDMLTTTVNASLSAVVTTAVTIDKTVKLAEREVDMLHHRQDLRLQAIQHELIAKADMLGLPKPKF